jgi:hypothetical protein
MNAEQLVHVIEERPLKGELVSVEENVLGEGREHVVHKGILKVGELEVPVVVKKAKIERPSDDISYAEIDQIRRKLEQAGKLPLPYVYGKIKEGFLIQEFIPGKTLEERIIEDPNFLDDERRLQLVKMALELAVVIEQETGGKFALKGLSPNDIIVAESGRLICIDPSIIPNSNKFDLRRSYTLNTLVGMFRETIFDTAKRYDGTHFRFSYKYPFDKDNPVRTKIIDSLTACFVKRPEDLTVVRENWDDLEKFDKDTARKNFYQFCEKNTIQDLKLRQFLFELYYSDVNRTKPQNERFSSAIFHNKSNLQDFKTYFEKFSGFN